MSLKYDGFVRKDVLQRMEEIKSLIRDYIPNVDLSDGEILYQWIKIIAMREESEWQIPTQQLIDNLSLPLAYGEMLRMLLANLGAYANSGTKATGNLLVSGDADSTIILYGTIFDTDTGLSFVTTSEKTMEYSIQMTRGSGSSDTINADYSIDEVEWIYSDEFGAGTEYVGYSYSDGVITWNGLTGNPLVGQTYYIRPSGNTIYVTIPVRSVFSGNLGNIPAGTTLTSGEVSTVSAVVLTSLSGGSDFETDEIARIRGLNARHRSRTKAGLKTSLENIEGVHEIAIQEGLGVDIAYPPTWDADNEPAEGTEVEFQDWVSLSQSFSPSTGIASIREIDLRIGKPSPSYSGSFFVMLENDSEIELTKSTITHDQLDYAKGIELQTVQVPLKYGPLDSTQTYYIKVSQSVVGEWRIGYYTGETFNDGNLENALFYSLPANSDIALRTKWLANYFTIHLLKEDGYDYSDVAAEIENYISEDGGGFGIYGVERTITEITENYIQLYATIFLKPGYVWSTVSPKISTSITDYINGLSIGENPIYLGFLGAIMNVAGVLNVTSVKIYKDSVEVSNSTNMNSVNISNTNKAVVDTPVTVLTHGNP